MLTLRQTAKALTANRTASFSAAGGEAPYTFEIFPQGAGGYISPVGDYAAPSKVNKDPAKAFDTIQVTDANGEKAEAKIFVLDTLSLFCEILESELGLDKGRVYLFNEKIMKPNDSGLFIAVSVVGDRPIANVNGFHSGVAPYSDQYMTILSTIGIDIMSRGHEARDRRFEVLMALASDYSHRQQSANGFQVSRLPRSGQIVNLSAVDGAAIPFRFHFDATITHSVTKETPASYYSTFNYSVFETNS